MKISLRVIVEVFKIVNFISEYCLVDIKLFCDITASGVAVFMLFLKLFDLEEIIMLFKESDEVLIFI